MTLQQFQRGSQSLGDVFWDCDCDCKCLGKFVPVVCGVWCTVHGAQCTVCVPQVTVQHDCSRARHMPHLSFVETLKN